MSQPFNRGAALPAPGELDSKLGEFWVNNPWDIVSKGHNLSAYERNRAFLNLDGADFLDISFLTGADSDGDGRCAIGADFRNTGQLDVLVRQAGGGTLLLYENRFPTAHYLQVTLRGTASNRLGIGARLLAHVGDRQIVREMFPVNSFKSQAPCVAHFGLEDASRVDRLSIRWPSGLVQDLHDLAADRHIVVTEGAKGDGAAETVVPGQTIAP